MTYRLSLAVIFAAVGSAALADDMRVVSSDATALFLPLAVNKSVVIDLPKEFKDVLVANPQIVNAVVRSNRRVYVIGTAQGQTNIYFFGADGRQVGALDVMVTTFPRVAADIAEPAQVIVVYRSVTPSSYSCTPTAGCITGPNPSTQNSNPFSFFSSFP